MMSSALLNVEWLPNVAGFLGVAGLLNVAKSREIAGLLRVAGSLSIMELQRIAGLLSVAGSLGLADLQRIAGLLSVAGLAMSWSLAICWLLTISLSLADSEGVALIRLGGVNLDCWTAFSKFNPNFLVLPNPISYLLLESLSSLRCFLDLWEAFLRVFSNLSDFLLNLVNDCFAGLGFLPAFLAEWKLAFAVPSFSYLRQSLVVCVVCTLPKFLHSLQDLLKWIFLWACFVAPLLGCLDPASFLWEAFSLEAHGFSHGYIRAQ